MVHLIYAGSNTITPTVVDGYQSSRTGQNKLHTIIGAEAYDVTLRPATLRSGTLKLGFHGANAQTNSANAEDWLSAADTFDFVSTDVLSVGMSFVVSDGGEVRRELDDATRDAWFVYVDFQEIP